MRQALILTEGDKMLLTPTYHVFDMYQVHQDATLPLDLQTEGATPRDSALEARLAPRSVVVLTLAAGVN